MTNSYITPITDRTYEDVEYARLHQDDLENHNKGAWNYTDANRVCNNLKYAAEWMYEQGFFDEPYSISVKTNWTETDIITVETLNTMIIDVMNNLKSYSRSDLTWYPVASVANMDYRLANWIEMDIDALATQEPIPPDTYELIVENGSGSGYYEAETVVSITANDPEDGYVFDYWSGDHLENIGSATAASTTYTMPNSSITLTANYTSNIPHTLTIVTYSGTETVELYMGDTYAFTADPAPIGEDKVFYSWTVEPSTYEDNLYEPAATTTFTMPNEDVTLTAVYITKGEKYLKVNNGNGTGYYEYGTYASVSSSKPSGATFTYWSGDTQYLTGATTQEYNSVLIPDVSTITITAHWSTPYTPATDINLTLVNATITDTGETSGVYDEGDKVALTADEPAEGDIIRSWSKSGGGSLSTATSTATATIGTSDMTVTVNYRTLEYYTLTVTTNSDTTTQTLEKYDYFTVDADPAPDDYTFDCWTGDTDSFNASTLKGTFYVSKSSTGTYMGGSDRTIVATYRPINPHTLTVEQLSGTVTYEMNELEKMTITAEDAPDGMEFTGWSKSGEGTISSYSNQTITFTFGNGDCTLTPNYVNVWTITVVDGTINSSSSALLRQGKSYNLNCRSRAVYESFDGWTQVGPGTITNTASTSTYFTVGEGDTTITANISQYPDKTLTIYFQDPDTGALTLISQTTYTYGTSLTVEAPEAPDKTTFLTWLGDVEVLSSALASSTSIKRLTQDAVITATYYYPESPEYYTLTLIKGYPSSGSYASGSQVSITANTPADGWEFYKWIGDTSYLVNPDTTLSENAVIMPKQSIRLEAIYNAVGELPLFRVTVSNGTASGSYTDSEGTVHDEEGAYIDIPAGTIVTLTADTITTGYVFSQWTGDFEEKGVTDLTATTNPATFTMVEQNINAYMKTRQLEKATLYTTNADAVSGEYVPGTYSIAGSLEDTDDYHYTFTNWTCADADGNDRIDVIADPTSIETTIVLDENDVFYVEAHYITHYKLTVINGQDTGSGYYYEGEVVNSITANESPEADRMVFDHWDDPMGVITSHIYDSTPVVTMKDTIATITAVYVSIDGSGNSVAITGDDLHTGVITRSNSYLVNGLFTEGTIVFDKDGCIGVITNTDIDEDDDTEDYEVKKLFYGGNF